MKLKRNIPWNKGKKGLHISPATEFKKGHKTTIHKDTLLKRSNSIKKIWKEHPEIYRNNNKSIKTIITQEIIDKIINLYKRGINGIKIAQILHVGDKKIYEILKTSNLKYGQGKNPNSRNGFKEGHDVPKEWRENWVTPKQDTKIEVKIQNFLKQLGIEFFTHQYMKQIEHSYHCDILIPSMNNLVIECDGDYWHKYPVGNDLDHIRTSELIKKGFKVLRLWEFEINKMSIEEFKNRLKERK